MLKTFIFLFIIGIIIAFLKFLLDLSKRPHTYPYEKQPLFLSTTELSFLISLEKAFPGKYRIMSKVRLADLIKVRPRTNIPQARAAFNRIQSKHIDFVVCDPLTLTPLFVIELDDKTHYLLKRQQRDDFLDNALHSASIPIFHFKAHPAYDPSDIKKIIDNFFTSSYNSTHEHTKNL